MGYTEMTSAIFARKNTKAGTHFRSDARLLTPSEPFSLRTH